MSSEIIYDKQFIKLSDNLYVPMFLQGSSNCTMQKWTRAGYREVLARDWSNVTFHLKGKVYGTSEEILNSIDNYRTELVERYKGDGSRYESDSKYEDKSFGYFTALKISGKSGTTFGMYKGVYVTGFKNAMTVEEMVKERISVRIRSGYDFDNNLKAAGKEGRTNYPKTSEELLSLIEEYTQYHAGTKVGFHLTLDMNDNRLKDMRRFKRLETKKETTEKVKKEVSEMFVFKNEHGYFVKGTRRGYKYSNYSDNYSVAKKYSRKEAETRLKEINKKWGLRGMFAIETIQLDKPQLV